MASLSMYLTQVFTKRTTKIQIVVSTSPGHGDMILARTCPLRTRTLNYFAIILGDFSLI